MLHLTPLTKSGKFRQKSEVFGALSPIPKPFTENKKIYEKPRRDSLPST